MACNKHLRYDFVQTALHFFFHLPLFDALERVPIMMNDAIHSSRLSIHGACTTLHCSSTRVDTRNRTISALSMRSSSTMYVREQQFRSKLRIATAPQDARENKSPSATPFPRTSAVIG
ncbi:hypothetical protein M404DRAFT_850160 [Pisolithus tinctorius Marx 270]|uniref:Uncharacterized protein n=1 Tax=Pisolithus tinctorius Marx 270 TaxID=870435 RepID=A0A0C3NBS6_PISTI|nr:hypothetical protein M404DRAFT_850160 [Pisolithus tinctorius Marx 270]